MNETIGKVFENIPITSFKRTKNLRDFLGGNTIVNSKVKKKKKPSTEKGDATHVTVGKTQNVIVK